MSDLPKPGTLLKAVGVRTAPHHLTSGKTYEVLEAFHGMLPGRDFVVVECDDGTQGIWHLSRFEVIADA